MVRGGLGGGSRRSHGHPEDRFDAVVALNLKGTFLPCQRFGRQMLEKGRGSIVNIASIGGFIAYPHTSAYLATKGAVVAATPLLMFSWPL